MDLGTCASSPHYESNVIRFRVGEAVFASQVLSRVRCNLRSINAATYSAIVKARAELSESFTYNTPRSCGEIDKAWISAFEVDSAINSPSFIDLDSVLEQSKRHRGGSRTPGDP